MDRRAKPQKGKAESKRPPSRESPKDESAEVRNLEQRLAESLDRERASSEILRIISSSPTDVQPVFDAIAQSAMRLCKGSYGVVVRYDGELVHLAALAHVASDGVDFIRQYYPTAPSRAA